MPGPTTRATPPGGRRMDLRTVTRAGTRRRERLRQADAELDRIADELIAAGEHANLALAAELAEVSRSTLYRRIKQRRSRGAAT